MKEPKTSEVKKYLTAILKLNRKYVTSERLSRVVGVYPEVINETLSYFEPTIKMDPEFNLMELVPVLKEFIKEREDNKNAPKAPAIKKKQVSEYESIADFIYKKMTFAGGLLDRNAYLSDTDLRILKRLIKDELENRKKEMKKSK